MSLNYEHGQYVFGLTYEGQSDGKNRKTRCLIMRRDRLERLVELRNEGDERFFYIGAERGSYEFYAHSRCNDLLLLHSLLNEYGKNERSAFLVGEFSISAAK